MGFREETILLTPDKAKKFLGINFENNRLIRNQRVATYARDIEEGNWNETVSMWQDPILISKSGKLINGQHRCSAVILANKPIKIRIKWDCPDDLYKFLDGGASRTIPDCWNGKNGNQMAALAKVMCALEDGSAPLKTLLQGKMDNSRTSPNVSRTEVLKKLEENSEYLDRMLKLGWKMAAPLKNKNNAIQSALLIIDYVGRGDRIDSFVDDFSEIISTSTSNMACKTYMLQCMANRNFRTSINWYVSCVFNAYENYRSGKAVLKFNRAETYISKYDKFVEEERKRRKK